MLTVKPLPDRLYYTFLIICLISALAGIVLLVLWYRSNDSYKKVLKQIRRRQEPKEDIGGRNEILLKAG